MRYRSVPFSTFDALSGRAVCRCPQARPHPPGPGPGWTLSLGLYGRSHIKSEQSRAWIGPEISPGPPSFLDPLSEPPWGKNDPLRRCLYEEPLGEKITAPSYRGRNQLWPASPVAGQQSVGRQQRNKVRGPWAGRGRSPKSQASQLSREKSWLFCFQKARLMPVTGAC